MASFTGSITVGRDVPIGTEVYRSLAYTTQNTQLNCDPYSQFTYAYATTPLPASSYVSPVYGNKPIYETGVPGIGVVAWADSQSKAFPADFNTTPGPGEYSNWSIHKFYFSLVKTANVVGTGTVSAANLPWVYYYVGSNKLIVEQGAALGRVNVIPGTCTTPDVTVNMGTHFTTELKGAGTTTAPVSFKIALNNCPAFFGTHWTNNVDGSVSDSNQVNNTISMQFDPTTSSVNPGQGVFALRSGGATGIGIQLLNAAGSPMPLGSRQPSGLVLTQTNGASYTISLQARYYQTSATTTAGQANSSLTVTLTYL